MTPKEKALKHLRDEGEHWSQPIEEAIDIALEEQIKLDAKEIASILIENERLKRDIKGLKKQLKEFMSFN